MHDPRIPAEKAAQLLIQRGDRIAIAESSSGGLISAALLSIPGASAYFTSGAVVYTGRALKGLLGVSRTDLGVKGLRSSSEPYAAFLAETVRARHRVEWGLSETGAAGPTGNSYGDPAGHTCIAVAGFINKSSMLRTSIADRHTNMGWFAEAALTLLVEALESAPPKSAPSR
jgi:nicotinamide-nucleotide amidase